MNFFARIRIILILLVCFISNTIMVQKVNLDTLNIDQLNQYKDKAVKISKAGAIITCCSAGVLATCIILGVASFQANGGWLVTDNAGDVIIGVAKGSLISTAAIGIPLWIVGVSREVKAELILQKLKIAPENSMAVGLGITIRF